MIAHYPGNMDSGEKVTGQETASGSVSEGLPILERKAGIALKLRATTD